MTLEEINKLAEFVDKAKPLLNQIEQLKEWISNVEDGGWYFGVHMHKDTGNGPFTGSGLLPKERVGDHRNFMLSVMKDTLQKTELELTNLKLN